MILIADAGSTKTHWAVVDASGQEPSRMLATLGINALTTPKETVREVLGEVSSWLGELSVESVHFYGAGCAMPSVCGDMRGELEAAIHPCGEIEVASDLLGAARALFGHGEGIVAILGTGSNSGLFRNGEILKNVPPMGYILGDEGSAAVFGKRIALDLARATAPQEVVRAVGMSKEDILEGVYRKPGANRFLADITRRVLPVEGCEYLEKLKWSQLESLFANCLSIYGVPEGFPVGFVGSMAYFMQRQLESLASRYGFRFEGVVRSPIDKLIQFHED